MTDECEWEYPRIVHQRVGSMKKERIVCGICGKVNYVAASEDEYHSSTAIYPEFAPDKSKLVETEIQGVVQHCSHCGYTFPGIDHGGNLSKGLVTGQKYCYPFGKEKECSPYVTDAWRVALAYERMGSHRMAARWYLYGAVLAEEEEIREDCLQKTFLYLKKEMDATQKKDQKPTADLMLAYLNVMRMLGMYFHVVRLGEEKMEDYRDVDRILMETVVDLAKNKNSTYYTYFTMLLLIDKTIGERRNRYDEKLEEKTGTWHGGTKTEGVAEKISG